MDNLKSLVVNIIIHAMAKIPPGAAMIIAIFFNAGTKVTSNIYT
ncbi:MAG: hypothetical protein ACYCXK_02945 [Candidatus Humimicrobiaceae bacterium]